MLMPDSAQAHSSFVWPVRVYYEDTDAGGVVYHASYLRFMERARTEWLRQLGIDQWALRDTAGVVLVVRDLHVRYHQAARLDQLLDVVTQLARLAGASLYLQQRIQTSPATLLTTAEVEVVCVDASSFRVKRLPKPIVAGLAKVAYECQC